MKTKGQIGLYIHWPFCLAKCPYCDFNSHVAAQIDHSAWQDAYLKALDHYAAQIPKAQIRSIYFGGGTPSLMAPGTAQAIIDHVQKTWQITNDIEITLEANPTSVEADKFEAFKVAGVNRVSLGVQSLKDKDLKFLGREHSANQAIQAIEIAQNTFDRYSFDLIYARPEQSLKAWEGELIQALKHAGEHLSLYQLTIERRTPFYNAHQGGEFIMPDDVLAADFYLLTQEIMAGAGLPAYEVSNHAQPGKESRHNLMYWHYHDYIGVGPGAHGRITVDGQKYATREHAAPNIWLARAHEGGKAAHAYEPLLAQDQFTEALMMGLRLTEGISRQALKDKTGQDFEALVPAQRRHVLINEGWLVDAGDVIRLTLEGRMRLNAILDFLLNHQCQQVAA